MKKKTLRDLKLKKDNTVIPAGTVCDIEFKVCEEGTELPSGKIAEFTHPYMSVTLPNGTVIRTKHYSAFFTAPSVNVMEKWNEDGVAKTVTGHRTEPDGYGPDGSPSWLLALGII